MARPQVGDDGLPQEVAKMFGADGFKVGQQGRLGADKAGDTVPVQDGTAEIKLMFEVVDQIKRLALPESEGYSHVYFILHIDFTHTKTVRSKTTYKLCFSCWLQIP